MLSGAKYFYNHELRVITDANIRIHGTFQLVLRAAGILESRLNAQNLLLPASTELMLEIDANQQPPVARYYYVDHSHKSEFWLESTTTSGLNLPPVTSNTHLSTLLAIIHRSSLGSNK